ncbi:hypothetical protein SSAG_05820 [Streptomyces sp. Mg1]|nr:hypothetical protein SSAG_05820 [Streptomyces sp. Mg1]
MTWVSSVSRVPDRIRSARSVSSSSAGLTGPALRTPWSAPIAAMTPSPAVSSGDSALSRAGPKALSSRSSSVGYVEASTSRTLRSSAVSAASGLPGMPSRACWMAVAASSIQPFHSRSPTSRSDSVTGSEPCWEAAFSGRSSRAQADGLTRHMNLAMLARSWSRSRWSREQSSASRRQRTANPTRWEASAVWAASLNTPGAQSSSGRAVPRPRSCAATATGAAPASYSSRAARRRSRDTSSSARLSSTAVRTDPCQKRTPWRMPASPRAATTSSTVRSSASTSRASRGRGAALPSSAMPWATSRPSGPVRWTQNSAFCRNRSPGWKDPAAGSAPRRRGALSSRRLWTSSGLPPVAACRVEASRAVCAGPGAPVAVRGASSARWASSSSTPRALSGRSRRRSPALWRRSSSRTCGGLAPASGPRVTIKESRAPVPRARSRAYRRQCRDCGSAYCTSSMAIRTGPCAASPASRAWKAMRVWAGTRSSAPAGPRSGREPAVSVVSRSSSSTTPKGMSCSAAEVTALRSRTPESAVRSSTRWSRTVLPDATGPLITAIRPGLEGSSGALPRMAPRAAPCVAPCVLPWGRAAPDTQEVSLAICSSRSTNMDVEASPVRYENVACRSHGMTWLFIRVPARSRKSAPESAWN